MDIDRRKVEEMKGEHYTFLLKLYGTVEDSKLNHEAYNEKKK